MRIGVISPDNFNDYISNINYGDYFQTNEYKSFADKNKLKTKLLAFYEGENIKGVCLIFYKRIFLEMLMVELQEVVVVIILI